MNLLSLILYGAVNTGMIAFYLRERGRFYQFPFWAGIIALGWFFPQAIGGYFTVSDFPENAYSDGMFFATACTVALWLGFVNLVEKKGSDSVWLGMHFDTGKLYWVGFLFCLFGFYFQWKLWSLPEEMLEDTQWTGSTVKYLFLGNIFKIGFLILWLLYLSQRRLLVPRLLVFIIPCLLLMLEAAVLRGRRASMMSLMAYLFVSLWFVRGIAVPRWGIIAGLSMGLILINSIGTYRAIMIKNKEAPMLEKLSAVATADYLENSKVSLRESGSEFKNYIFYRKICADDGLYDYGGIHWNVFVHNYVPAQIFGRDFKESLMLEPPAEEDPKLIAERRYGHMRKTGATSTGYRDAFGSFGWFGFVKFYIIGAMMGVLYRYAMRGRFLGQLLYVYMLGTAMHAITHITHRILIASWVYFFALAFPVLYFARLRRRQLALMAEMNYAHDSDERIKV